MSSSKVHSFQESLKKGQDAEALWMELMTQKYPMYQIERLDGRRHDFVMHSPLGSFTIELKSDSYDMAKTPNLFMERWSVWETKKPGGIWQAQSKDIDLYCYWYPKNKIMLTGDVNRLILNVEAMKIPDKKLIPIFNRGFITKGYKLERKSFYEVEGLVTHCNLGESDNDGLR